MKWLFLINNSSFFPEFFGKLAEQIMEQGDECVIAMNSKIVEFSKKKVFPKNAKFISKVDWAAKNYQKDKKEFGSLSWKELVPTFDRYKPAGYFSYDNSFKIISQTYQFFDFLFQQEKPDIIIAEPPAGLFHEVGYNFCRRNNIPYVGLASSRFEDRLDIYDLEFTFSKYEKAFNETKSADISEKERGFAKNFVEEFLSHRYMPSYTVLGLEESYPNQFGIIRHYIKRIKDSGVFLLKCFLNMKYFKDFDYETEISLKYSITTPWRTEKRLFKRLFQKNIFSKMGDFDEHFFFYPLQYQPESSTSVWATYYCDQLATIKNIVFSLPFPYKLYVKEHPGCVGLRARSFYEKLQELPNVVLVPAHEKVENLIKKSSGVITLTSTIGLEAALAGKRTYVLGNAAYFYHPSCRKIKNFDDLKRNIQDDLINNPKIDNLEDINCRFITSCIKNTINGNIISASLKKDTNDYKLMYQSLLKIFSEIK